MAAQDLKKQLNDFLGGRCVLVIEPSGNFRNSIKQFLTNLKVRRMKLVSNVADARREMLTNKVGLFVVEWSLEETNGLQFCRALRKEAAFKDTPFLLMSTENLRQDVILATEVKIDAYLLKPFSYEDFMNQLAILLRGVNKVSRRTNLLDMAEEKLVGGDLDAAEQLIGEASTTLAKSARALSLHARIMAGRGDHRGAMSKLHQATEANPEFIEAYRIMLEISEKKGDRTGTIQAASILNSMSPDNPRYTLVLARVYLEMSQLEGSEKFFKKTLSLSPKMAEAYKGLGTVYLAQEEYDKAMKNFKKALDLDAEDISTLNSLGMTYIRMGQYKEGIDKYMIALKIDPCDARVLFNLGHAFEKRGEPDKARWHYAQALVHRPDFDKAIRGLERMDKQASPAPKDDEPEDIDGPWKKSS